MTIKKGCGEGISGYTARCPFAIRKLVGDEVFDYCSERRIEMGIRVGDFKVVYESVTMEAINPEYLCVTREQIEDYLKDNPMPNDPAYSVEDMIGDITQSSGFYCLPQDIKDETADFIATLIGELISG